MFNINNLYGYSTKMKSFTSLHCYFEASISLHLSILTDPFATYCLYITEYITSSVANQIAAFMIER